MRVHICCGAPKFACRPALKLDATMNSAKFSVSSSHAPPPVAGASLWAAPPSLQLGLPKSSWNQLGDAPGCG
jgi:hypothetical protein